MHDDRDSPALRRDLELVLLLNRIAEAATDAESPEQVLEVALERVCAFTGWPLGHALVRDQATAVLVPSGIWHDPEQRFPAFRRSTGAQRFAMGEGLPGRVLASGEPAWIVDFAGRPEFPRAAEAGRAGLRAAFAFPVRTRESIAAVLEFFGTSAAEPDEALLAAMAVVGSQLGRVFERLRAAQLLREREERFRALAENAADAIVSIDDKDRIVYANPAVERTFGYTADELVDLLLTELMPERFRVRHRVGLSRHLETGERRLRWDGVELSGLHRDGHEIPLEVTFGSYNREGRHFFIGVMRDVTDRAAAERERSRLLEAERRARAAAEVARGEAERRADEEQALREAMTAVTAAYTVEQTTVLIAEGALLATAADGAFVERIEVDGSLVVGAVAGPRAPSIGSSFPFRGSVSEAVAESGRPELIPCVADAERGLQPMLRDHCGDCSALVVPLLDAGEAIGSLILLRDMHKHGFRPDEVERAFTFGELASLAFHKIHLFEEAEQRRDELEDVIESRSRLVRGFSHDVKNPLGAANGFLQLLLQGVYGELTEAQRTSIDRTRRAVEGAVALIDDLLELARAETGQLAIEWAPTDMREAARESTEEYRAQAEAAGLTVELEVPEDFPTIEGDPSRVRQVIGNLLANAVKYTPAGGGIAVRADSDPWDSPTGRVAVSVTDTGPGIPEDKQEYLFQEFTRLEPTQGSGAGIGLAISRRIARALGGDLVLDSAPGRGSTFTFWLPLRRVGEPD